MRAQLEYELGNFDAGATYIARLQDAAVGRAARPDRRARFMVSANALAERIAGSEERLDLGRYVGQGDALAPAPRSCVGHGRAKRKGDDRGAAKQPKGPSEHYHVIEPQKRTACFIIPLTFDRLLALLAVTFRADRDSAEPLRRRAGVL